LSRRDQAIGRYIYLTIEGVEYRVYYEESGRGIPLILQHTAGADGRQWRHLLEDTEITSDFRVIAYDLPYHGRSIPPLNVKWWLVEYRLRLEFLMQFVLALIEELELIDPVYMGCSMGGNLAADLALHHPGHFRALIGLEAAAVVKGYFIKWWDHPRVGNETNAAQAFGLMSPTSPEQYRRETAWLYGQGAYSVFKGDIYYYSIDHDLSVSASRIDTSHTPLYLLTGEYDWDVTPVITEALAAQIRGAKFIRMDGLGHFAMSENPALFRSYIWPVLKEIRDRQ
jgi:pimeloyl-ACP methyl ester carboxylesterase